MFPHSRRNRLFQKLYGRHAKCVGEFLDDGDGWISGAAFDVADVGAVDPGFECELFLRQTFFGPQASQVLSEPHAYIHAASLRGVSMIGLQTIRDIPLDLSGQASLCATLIVDRTRRIDGYAVRFSRNPLCTLA